MELMQNIAKMQSSQISKTPDTSIVDAGTKVAAQKAPETVKNDDPIAKSQGTKIESQEDLERLVKQLNHALDPFRTSLRFGFDNSSEDFYVSVIETKSNKMIRRFPATEATEILPKIKELNGFLFDEKG